MLTAGESSSESDNDDDDEAEETELIAGTAGEEEEGTRITSTLREGFAEAVAVARRGSSVGIQPLPCWRSGVRETPPSEVLRSSLLLTCLASLALVFCVVMLGIVAVSRARASPQSEAPLARDAVRKNGLTAPVAGSFSPPPQERWYDDSKDHEPSKRGFNCGRRRCRLRLGRVETGRRPDRGRVRARTAERTNV